MCPIAPHTSSHSVVADHVYHRPLGLWWDDGFRQLTTETWNILETQRGNKWFKVASTLAVSRVLAVFSAKIAERAKSVELVKLPFFNFFFDSLCFSVFSSVFLTVKYLLEYPKKYFFLLKNFQRIGPLGQFFL